MQLISLNSLLRNARFLSSLRQRDFRFLWFGSLAATSAIWMETVSYGWLVFELTDSPLILGVTNFARGIPFLIFGPLGGVAADRLDRRWLLLMSQSAGVVLALTLTALVFAGLVEMWHLILTGFLGGVVASFNQPARQTLVVDLVERTNLVNAIALGASAFNISRLLAPVVAGVLIGSVGVAVCFLVQAICNVIAFVFTVPLPGLKKVQVNTRSSMGRDFLDGVRYVKNNALVVSLILLPLAIMFLGMPVSTVMPVFARDILNSGASGLGLLTAAQGSGSLLALLSLAAIGDFGKKGLITILACFLYSGVLVVFAASEWLPVSAALMIAAGCTSAICFTLTNTLLQSLISDEFRGRVTSIVMLDRGLMPFGGLFCGFLAEAFGAPASVSIMAIAFAGFSLVLTVGFPAVRRLN